MKGILEALGYGKSDICMVSAKNEQVMIDNGSIKFEDYLVDYLLNKVTFITSDILNIRQYGSGYVYRTMKINPLWNTLSTDHPVKAFIEEYIQCSERVSKHPKIVEYMKIDDVNLNPIELVTDCPIIKFTMDRVSHWNIEDILTILVELEKK